MKRLSQAQINSKFGVPGNGKHPDPQWAAKNLATVELPYAMRLAWSLGEHVHTVRIHRLAATALTGALTEIWNHTRIEIKAEHPNHNTQWYDAETMARLRTLGLDILGGTYNYRKVVGGNTLSMHAYGIAIDLDPTHNALGKQGRMPAWVVEIFERHGFCWGGWFSRKDPMHFESTKGE